jgi:YD repeat-containing protein
LRNRPLRDTNPPRRPNCCLGQYRSLKKAEPEPLFKESVIAAPAPRAIRIDISGKMQIKPGFNVCLSRQFLLGSVIVLGALVLISPTASASQNKAAVAAPTGVIDIWGGAVESIALRSDGTVWTWGWGEFGLLGNGHGLSMMDPSTAGDSNIPFQVLGPGGIGHFNSIVAIAGGERHNVALDSNGEVWTWGWNYFGQLGSGISCPGDFNTAIYATDCESTTPVKIPGFANVKAIASRGYHTLALKNDGTVWAWGYNAHGRLGDGTTTDQHSPVQVVGLTGHGGVTAISGGGDVNVALMADHTLMAWGRNFKGEIGNGTADPSDIGQWTAVSVSQSTGLTNVAQVATGWSHVVALASDGTVWTWGNNDGGELGNGTTISSNVPIQVQGLSNVVGVSAGDGSTVVLKADGAVWAWGLIRHGDGTNYSYGLTPVQVAGIDHVTLVRARDWHVLALKSDGTVWAWGSNQRGECGNGTVGGNTDTPVQVIFPNFLSAPSVPTNVNGVAGNGSITVSFGAPASDGGATITGYSATCTSFNGGVARSNTGGAAAVSIVVRGLTNGKSYTCTVTATNAAGMTGPASAPFIVVRPFDLMPILELLLFN